MSYGRFALSILTGEEYRILPLFARYHLSAHRAQYGQSDRYPEDMVVTRQNSFINRVPNPLVAGLQTG